jgi:hypothetical protein
MNRSKLLSMLKKYLWSTIESFFGYARFTLIFYVVLPLPLLILALNVSEKLYFYILLLITYYFSGFIFLLLMDHLVGKRKKKRIRSPFHFIRKLTFASSENPPLRPLIGAEVGVHTGHHATQILNGYLNIEKLVLVDPWVPYSEKKDSFEEFDTRYKQVCKLFDGKKNVEIIRDYSVEASKLYPDKFFDFIYLDGDHEYSSVMDDLESWYPKLKTYGVMCGDDFGHPSGLGVIKAVTEFAYSRKLLVFSGEDLQFWFVKI